MCPPSCRPRTQSQEKITSTQEEYEYELSTALVNLKMLFLCLLEKFFFVVIPEQEDILVSRLLKNFDKPSLF